MPLLDLLSCMNASCGSIETVMEFLTPHSVLNTRKEYFRILIGRSRRQRIPKGVSNCRPTVFEDMEVCDQIRIQRSVVVATSSQFLLRYFRKVGYCAVPTGIFVDEIDHLEMHGSFVGLIEAAGGFVPFILQS